MNDANTLKIKLTDSNIVLLAAAQRLVLRVIQNHKSFNAESFPLALNQWCESIKDISPGLIQVDWAFEELFKTKDNEKKIIAFYFKNNYGETFKVNVDLKISILDLIKDPLFNPSWQF